MPLGINLKLYNDPLVLNQLSEDDDWYPVKESVAKMKQTEQTEIKRYYGINPKKIYSLLLSHKYKLIRHISLYFVILEHDNLLYIYTHIHVHTHTHARAHVC